MGKGINMTLETSWGNIKVNKILSQILYNLCSKNNDLSDDEKMLYSLCRIEGTVLCPCPHCLMEVE